MESILILGEQANLEIEVLYRTSDSYDFYDGNWLRCQIGGEFPGFTSRFETFLRTDELMKCMSELTELQKLNSEEAKFRTLEDGLSLDFKRDYTGKVIITGIMTAIDLSGCRLNFNLEIDNPALDKLIGNIKATLEQYPIVGSNDTFHQTIN